MERRARRLVAVLLMAGPLPSCWGGAVSQAPSCEAYVACVQAMDAAASLVTNLDRFAAGGVCWDNSDIAELCETACTRALDRLRERTPTLLPECAQ